jgi:FBD
MLFFCTFLKQCCSDIIGAVYNIFTIAFADGNNLIKFTSSSLQNYQDGYGYYLSKGFWDEQGSFSFLDHLKTVTVKGFYGEPREEEFLRYLVVHGKVLENITLLCSKYISNKFVETKKQQVCFDKRASPDLELFFFRDAYISNHFSLWNDLIEGLVM